LAEAAGSRLAPAKLNKNLSYLETSTGGIDPERTANRHPLRVRAWRSG